MNLWITDTILKLLLLLHNQSEQSKLTGHTKYRTSPDTVQKSQIRLGTFFHTILGFLVFLPLSSATVLPRYRVFHGVSLKPLLLLWMELRKTAHMFHMSLQNPKKTYHSAVLHRFVSYVSSKLKKRPTPDRADRNLQSPKSQKMSKNRMSPGWFQGLLMAETSLDETK